MKLNEVSMSLNYLDLGIANLRAAMLSEAATDLSAGKMYIGPYLNDDGATRWPGLLSEAIEHGSDGTLAAELVSRHCFRSFTQRRKPTGGFTTVKVPFTAPEMLSEGEFNRYYIRALCLYAIALSIPYLIVYRAKQVMNPRPESEMKIGTHINPVTLLADLRTHIGVDTALGLPAGPNSGLSVKLPNTVN